MRAYARYAAGGPARTPERELVERHGALLDRCARRLAGRTGGAVSPDDLWSAGAMGLIDAARRYDAARDVKFETFAEHRIRGAMIDEMRRMDHLPRRLRAEADQLERERARLAQTLGREPGADDLAAALGRPAEEVAEVLLLLQPALQVEEELAVSLVPAADEAIARGQLAAGLAGAIGALPERLQTLLALYYDEGLTYREIAKVLAVSEPRVCQLHSDAMKRLRAALAEDAPPA
jgi:RNA polymerase sigma factor for flagellar operon FliA